MSAVSLAQALRNKAEASYKPGDEFSFAMDSSTDGTDYEGRVLLAIALPGACGVIAIDKSEYDLEAAQHLGELMGFKRAVPPTAAERARKAKALDTN